MSGTNEHPRRLAFGATNLTNRWRPVPTKLQTSGECLHPDKQVFCKVEHVEVGVLAAKARIVTKCEDPRFKDPHLAPAKAARNFGCLVPMTKSALTSLPGRERISDRTEDLAESILESGLAGRATPHCSSAKTN